MLLEKTPTQRSRFNTTGTHKHDAFAIRNIDRAVALVCVMYACFVAHTFCAERDECDGCNDTHTHTAVELGDYAKDEAMPTTEQHQRSMTTVSNWKLVKQIGR